MEKMLSPRKLCSASAIHALGTWWAKKREKNLLKLLRLITGVTHYTKKDFFTWPTFCRHERREIAEVPATHGEPGKMTSRFATSRSDFTLRKCYTRHSRHQWNSHTPTSALKNKKIFFKCSENPKLLNLPIFFQKNSKINSPSRLLVAIQVPRNF